MLSAAYYSCLSFFWPDAELVIIVLAVSAKAASVAVPARLTSCHITPEEVLMNGLSCKANGIAGGKPYHYPVLTRCSYKVLRAQP